MATLVPVNPMAGRGWLAPILRLLLVYLYLQVLDVLTTMAFLMAGVSEGNPMVREAMRLCGSPVAGLVVVKTGAVLLGLYCWWGGRERLLRRVNLFFGGLIAWNLCCLIAGLALKVGA